MEEGRVGYKEYKDRGSAVGVGPERLRSSRRPEWPEQRAEGKAGGGDQRGNGGQVI